MSDLCEIHYIELSQVLFTWLHAELKLSKLYIILKRFNEGGTNIAIGTNSQKQTRPRKCFQNYFQQVRHGPKTSTTFNRLPNFTRWTPEFPSLSPFTIHLLMKVPFFSWFFPMGGGDRRNLWSGKPSKWSKVATQAYCHLAIDTVLIYSKPFSWLKLF